MPIKFQGKELSLNHIEVSEVFEPSRISAETPHLSLKDSTISITQYLNGKYQGRWLAHIYPIQDEEPWVSLNLEEIEELLYVLYTLNEVI